jgi:RNA recognition motif-containing protein
MSDVKQVDKAYKMFVGNVPYLCTDEEFVECFKNYNGYLSADVVRKPNSKFSRGFGFVTFVNKTDGDELMKLDGGMTLKGRVLRFSSYETEKEVKNYLVFVRGVTPEMTADDLKSALEEYGTVTEVTLNCNRETGKPTGSASVGFSSLDEMRKALNARNKSVDDMTMLQLYPFRKHPKHPKHQDGEQDNRERRNGDGQGYKNARAAYMAGFQAGQLTPSNK